MENYFCAPRVYIRQLWNESKRDFTKELFLKSLEKYKREEIEEQLNNKKGEIIDAINAESKLSSKKTENVEVMNALQLSDFYFPHEETDICFAMRRGVDIKEIKSYEDLVDSFENDTHVDCKVKAKERELFFQIKRYPQEYLAHSNEAFINWFENKVLLHYAGIKGTYLVIILQPTVPLAPNTLDIQKIADYLKINKDRLIFEEIALIYNDSKYFALHKLFPEHKRILVELEHGLKRMRGDL